MSDTDIHVLTIILGPSGAAFVVVCIKCFFLFANWYADWKQHKEAEMMREHANLVANHAEMVREHEQLDGSLTQALHQEVMDEHAKLVEKHDFKMAAIKAGNINKLP